MHVLKQKYRGYLVNIYMSKNMLLMSHTKNDDDVHNNNDVHDNKVCGIDGVVDDGNCIMALMTNNDDINDSNEMWLSVTINFST